MLDDIIMHMKASGETVPERSALTQDSALHFQAAKHKFELLQQAIGTGRMPDILECGMEIVWELLTAMAAAGLDIDCAWLEIARSKQSLVDPMTKRLFVNDDGEMTIPVWYRKMEMEPLMRRGMPW